MTPSTGLDASLVENGFGRGLVFRQVLLPFGDALEHRFAQQGKLFVVVDPTQIPHLAVFAFDGREAFGDPALPLITVHPPFDLADVLRQTAVYGFDAVRRLETLAELGEEAEPVQRKRLFEDFLERSSGAAVQLLESTRFGGASTSMRRASFGRIELTLIGPRAELGV